MLLLEAKPKRKPNAKPGRLNMPEILNTEPTKSESSDKLKKFLPLN